jgi:calcineurin-like phosphoesterase family protein
MTVGWLHVTDLHVGMKDQDYRFPRVRTEFFEDLKWLHERSGPWDLIFFTGDLTQRGAKNEFEKLGDFLARLDKECTQLSGTAPLLVPIPGNHDLERFSLEKASNPTGWMFANWHDEPEVQNIFWDQPQSDYRKLVTKAFENYTAWQMQLPVVRQSAYVAGLLPGEFAFQFEKGGFKIGVLGLNSSFLHLNDTFGPGKLAFSRHQIGLQVQNLLADWKSANDLNVVLTHHPISWLTSDGQTLFSTEVWPSMHLHLHGHMHEARAVAQALGGGSLRRTLQGASLFGAETYKSPSGTMELRLHGYSASRVQRSSGRLSYEHWPRLATKLQDDSYRIGPDLSFSLDRSTLSHRDPPDSIPNRGVQANDDSACTLVPAFDKLDTLQIVERAKKEILLFSNYAESWLQFAFEAYLDYFKRGGKMTLVLPDPSQRLVVELLRLRYPDRENIAEQIRGTTQLARALAAKAGAPDAVHVRFSSNPPSYWMFVVDRAKAYVSPYEQARQFKVRAPVFVIDLLKVEGTEFWQKEIDGFLEVSRELEVAPSAWTLGRGYDELGSLRVALRQVAIGGRNLLEMLAEAAKGKRWGSRPSPTELVNALTAGKHRGTAYWHLVVRGVLEFNNIDEWGVNDGAPYTESLSYVQLADRGWALLQALADE